MFPAFDSNYKTRKRAFKCCRKCRNKRIRCVILDNYELKGCDNCEANGLACDLLRSERIKTPISRKSSDPGPRVSKPEPPTIPKPHAKAFEQFLKLSSLVKNEFDAMNGVLSHQFPTFKKSFLEGSLQTSESLNPNEAVAAPETRVHGVDTSLPTLTQLNLTSSQLPFRGKTPQKLSNSWPASSECSVSSTSINAEALELYIESVDSKFLKAKFNFNTAIQNSRLYSIQSQSGQKTGNSPKSRPGKFLDLSDAVHFRFLLSIHAFTLSTPGFCVISGTDLVSLFEIYFYKVNSIFPIVFEEEFWELYKRNKIPSIVSYAVVLNAARDELAFPILARSFVNTEVEFETNCSRFLKELEMKIRQILIFLPEVGDTEKLTRLVTLLLLSLTFKFNNFGNEQSSEDIGNCTSYAYSLLIHQEFFHKRIAEAGAIKKSLYLRNLWWVIFILDRFNALMNGKAMYIKRVDFNIELPKNLPHLNRLVHLAYALDDMTSLVFRPQRKNGKGELVSHSDTLPGDPKFNPAKFIEEELDILADMKTVTANLLEYRKFQEGRSAHLPSFPVEKYKDRMVYFLERILRNQMTFVLRTGQLKCLREKNRIDDISLHLCEKLYEIFTLMEDSQSLKLVMSAPIIPLILLVAFSVPMAARYVCLGLKKEPISIPEERLKDLIKLGNGYLEKLKRYSQHWWFVAEVINRIGDLDFGLDPRRDNAAPSKPRPKSVLSVNELVTDEDAVESQLPVLLPITSPGFYEEVFAKGGEGDNDKCLPHEGRVQENNACAPFESHNSQILNGPVMTFEGMAVRALNGDLGRIDGNHAQDLATEQEHFTPEDVYFDVAQLAEMVTTQTLLFPNILDYYTDERKFS